MITKYGPLKPWQYELTVSFHPWYSVAQEGPRLLSDISGAIALPVDKFDATAGVFNIRFGAGGRARLYLDFERLTITENLDNYSVLMMQCRELISLCISEQIKVSAVDLEVNLAIDLDRDIERHQSLSSMLKNVAPEHILGAIEDTRLRIPIKGVDNECRISLSRMYDNNSVILSRVGVASQYESAEEILLNHPVESVEHLITTILIPTIDELEY